MKIEKIGEKWDELIFKLPLFSPKLIEVSYHITILPEVISDSLPFLAEILPDKTVVIEKAIKTAKKNVLIKIEKSFRKTKYFDSVVVKTAEKIFFDY